MASGNPFHSTRTTEISVTSEVVVGSPMGAVDPFSRGMPHNQFSRPPTGGKNGYNVTVITSEPNSQSQARSFYVENSLRGEHGSFDQAPNISTVQLPAPKSNGQTTNQRPARRAATQADRATWVYAKVAVLFFVAMMVTWIPSSANRVYSVVHPGQVSVGLEFASAFVLPLQGFWNAVIYTITSLPACGTFFRQLRGSRPAKARELGPMARIYSGRRGNADSEDNRRSDLFTEIDSITQLASRPNTKGSEC
jgi:hypothetical protein